MASKRKWQQDIAAPMKCRLACLEVPIVIGRQQLSALISMTDTYAVVQFSDLLTIFTYLFPNKPINIPSISLLQEYLSDKYYPSGPIVSLPQRNALTIVGVIGWLQMSSLFETPKHEAHYFILWILEELFPAMQNMQKTLLDQVDTNGNPPEEKQSNSDDILMQI